MPLFCSSVKLDGSTPSSNKEQIIPLLSCPRITPFLISPPGNFAPSKATITFCPAATFGAPQTIFNTSSPTFTVVQCK